MNCEEFRDRLDPFLRRLLPPGESAGAEAHLAGCPACRALARDAETDDEALRRKLAGLRGRWERALGKALAESAPPRSVAGRIARFVAWSSAAAAAALFAILATGPAGEPKVPAAARTSADLVNRLLVDPSAEAEIRARGQDALDALLAYVGSKASRRDPVLREAAVRILCDLADVRWAVEMVDLLEDNAPAIRRLAAAAIDRIGEPSIPPSPPPEAWEKLAGPDLEKAREPLRRWGAKKKAHAGAAKKGPAGGAEKHADVKAAY